MSWIASIVFLLCSVGSKTYILYNGCNYLSMLRFKLNHVRKRGPRRVSGYHFASWLKGMNCNRNIDNFPHAQWSVGRNDWFNTQTSTAAARVTVYRQNILFDYPIFRTKCVYDITLIHCPWVMWRSGVDVKWLITNTLWWILPNLYLVAAKSLGKWCGTLMIISQHWSDESNDYRTIKSFWCLIYSYKRYTVIYTIYV